MCSARTALPQLVHFLLLSPSVRVHWMFVLRGWRHDRPTATPRAVRARLRGELGSRAAECDVSPYRINQMFAGAPLLPDSSDGRCRDIAAVVSDNCFNFRAISGFRFEVEMCTEVHA